MRVKNISGVEKIYLGQTLANNQEYDIPVQDLFKWQGEDIVLQDLSSGDLLIGNASGFVSGSSNAINMLLEIDTSIKDTSGRQIVRTSATIEGWHYQLLSTEMSTSKLNGFFSKNEDGTDTGFVSSKIYDVNNTEIIDAANEFLAVKTIVWIRPPHNYEILGSLFGQFLTPSQDIYMWATGLPGIANIKFAQGGMNLRHFGIGTFNLADGRASKYLAYNSQIPDMNSFKLTFKYPIGFQHTFQFSFELFKAP